jgi:hypothetical protein
VTKAMPTAMSEGICNVSTSVDLCAAMSRADSTMSRTDTDPMTAA